MKNGQIGWEMVRLDENFGDKKMSFWKKIAKISIFEKNNSPSGDISPVKETLLVMDKEKMISSKELH
jgi:hypothetical protein